VVFSKDGMKVGIKEVRSEDYADKTQRYVPSPTLILFDFCLVRGHALTRVVTGQCARQSMELRLVPELQEPIGVEYRGGGVDIVRPFPSEIW
jgi:hypothetical protein